MAKLLIDIDGVMADFCEGFTRTARGLDTRQPIISTVAQPTWDLKGVMDRKLVNATWDHIRRADEWWLGLHPLITEPEVKQLKYHMIHDQVTFCTARKHWNPKGPGPADQTIRWLEYRGLVRPSVICSSKKGEVAKAIGATHAIDDKPENVCMIHWLTDGACESFVLDRPYNRDFSFPAATVRVGSLGEFFDAVGRRESTHAEAA